MCTFQGERIHGEGEGLSYQLSQRAIKPLNMISFAALLFDHLMLFVWNDALIRLPIICIESSILHCSSPVLISKAL